MLEKEHTFPASGTTREAAEKVQKIGRLNITGEDWAALGGTVPPDLKQNPGKTRADLMSDEQIAQYLQKKWDTIQVFLKKDGTENTTFSKSFLDSEREDWQATIAHLRSIDRLPKAFDQE